jgi:hypothetical protein
LRQESGAQSGRGNGVGFVQDQLFAQIKMRQRHGKSKSEEQVVENSQSVAGSGDLFAVVLIDRRTATYGLAKSGFDSDNEHHKQSAGAINGAFETMAMKSKRN